MKRQQIRDVKIRKIQNEVREESALAQFVVENNQDNFSFNNLKEKLKNVEEMINPSRRNFLKILAASGGVIVTSSFLNKVNKFKDIASTSQQASAIGGLSKIMPNVIRGDSFSGDSDLTSFFDNFKIVKSSNEYVLYNKTGDKILVIDRDA